MWRRRHTFILLAALLVVVALASIVYRPLVNFWARTHPNYRVVNTKEISWPANPDFQNCWLDSSKRFTGSIFWPQIVKNQGPLAHCEADGTYLPVNGDSLMVLSVLIPRGEPPPGAPAMQLAITSLVEISNDVDRATAILPEARGHPPVQCQLNVVQADFIRKHGVPQSLMDAMQQAAREAGWAPLDDTSRAILLQDIKVDPNPHFPK